MISQIFFDQEKLNHFFAANRKNIQTIPNNFFENDIDLTCFRGFQT